MGLSYILMLVAFYVDNGKQLPLWKDLPHFMYWLIPMVVGIPFVVRASVAAIGARALLNLYLVQVLLRRLAEVYDVALL
jgi:hypothetical protein